MKKTIILIQLISLLLMSCTYNTITLTEHPERKQADINIGFTPNTIPKFNSSLTTPNPGLKTYLTNTTINISAHENNEYTFYKWVIYPEENKPYEVYEKELQLKINENHVINAYFGCKTNKVCTEGHECKEKLCTKK